MQLKQCVDFCFDFLCGCFGDDASLDDLIEYFAAALLVEQLDGVLEKLRSQLLDNGGRGFIVEQFFNGQASEIHVVSPSYFHFRLARAID